MREITALADLLEQYGVPRHPDIDKAAAAWATLQAAVRIEQPLTERLLDLDEDQLRHRLTDGVIRQDASRMGTAVNRLQRQLDREAAEILAAQVPEILKTLRLRFDRAAKAVHAAARAGLRPGMSAEYVLDLNSPDAVAAYRGLPKHTAVLQDIANVRIRLSEMLDIPPQITQGERNLGERVDYTACFTHPDTRVLTGYADHNGEDRWLALTLATGGRLRLNDPAETLTMLEGEGDSEGWVVDSASCVVTDTDGAQLMLNRGDWIPTWVDDEQLAGLIEKDLVHAAPPGAERANDRHPDTAHSSWAVAR